MDLRDAAERLDEYSRRPDFRCCNCSYSSRLQIHPFRDGNTRSQSLFVSNLARAAGHPIDWRLVEVGDLRAARLQAMQGDERHFSN
jgi:fido (protein-threonine AMPylation protein)